MFSTSRRLTAKFVITKRGKAVAKLVPVQQEREREQEVLAKLRGKAKLLVPERGFLRPLTKEAVGNCSESAERWSSSIPMPPCGGPATPRVWGAVPGHGSPRRNAWASRASSSGGALRVRKRKLHLGLPVSDWADAIQSVPRVDSLPLTAEIAVQADD